MNMGEQPCFENYPLRIVAVSTLFNFSILIIGFYILAGFGILVSLLYLAYYLAMEYRILSRSCVNCYYYGKTCFSGRGRVCSLLFKKSESGLFIDHNVTWKDIFSDLLVSIFPIVGGLILLAISFSWLILVLVIILTLLSTVGNATIRGSLACKYCKQRELGCPALKLFEKKTTESPDQSSSP